MTSTEVADTVALLAGTTLSRRLTAVEVAGGYLELAADLQALTGITDALWQALADAPRPSAEPCRRCRSWPPPKASS